MRLRVAMALTALQPSALLAQDTLVVEADNPPHWGASLELRETLRLGKLDGLEHETFGRIVGVVADGSGIIYIADSQASAIRRFDANGRYLGSLGRAGDGPGEFRRMTNMSWLPGDRIVVQDANRSRAIVYGPGGAFEREFQLFSGLSAVRSTLQADLEGNVYVLAIRRDPSGPPMQLQGVDDPPFIWIRHGADGGVRDSIEVPLQDHEGPSFTMITGDGPRYPLTVATVSDMSPAGYLLWGRNDEFAFHRRLSDGRVVKVTRRAERVAASDEERREWEAVADFFEKQGASPYPPVPGLKPYFRALWADVDGRVWVQRYTETYRYEYTPEELDARAGRPAVTIREVQAFDVFQPEGRFLSRVTLPRDNRLLFARGAELWTLAVGPLDEPYVVRYRLEGPTVGS